MSLEVDVLSLRILQLRYEAGVNEALDPGVGLRSLFVELILQELSLVLLVGEVLMA